MRFTLLFAPFLALLLAGCPAKKEDFSDSGKNTVATKTPTDRPIDTKAGTDIIRPTYTPDKDPELHRIDMVEFEREAADKLRKFSLGQRTFVTDIHPTPIDLDGDGVGEYAFLLELMGASFCRTKGGVGMAPIQKSWPLFRAADTKGRAYFDRVTSGAGFIKTPKVEYYVSAGGDVFWLNRRGVAEHKGYYFMFFLPGRDRVINAGKKVPPGDPSLADLHERRFAAIAWPMRQGVTGRRVFATYKPEEVWSRWNIKPLYDGLRVIPDPWAALDRAGKNIQNLDGKRAYVDSGLTASDGGAWRFYGERRGKKEADFEWCWSKSREIEEFRKDGGSDALWMQGAEKKKGS